MDRLVLLHREGRMTTEQRVHRLEVRTDVLDAIVKSLMQSVTANTNKRRRFDDKSPRARQAAEEGELLAEGLTAALRAQTESWSQ
jgi:hypothetical protein